MNGATPSLRATAPAVFPGTDPRRAAECLQAELEAPHLIPLPELPGRGHHSSRLGRSVAQLSELYAELTSYGWRLIPRPGADHQRTTHLMRADVDALADVLGERAEGRGGSARGLMLEMLGPVSLAAQLALPTGEKALIDHGARRDLSESLAAGVVGHLEHVRRTCSPERLSVVLQETDYGRVRSGQVPTVSGYRTIRSLGRDETRTMIGVMAKMLRDAGADEIFLDLGVAPEQEHLEDFHGHTGSRVDGFALPVNRLHNADWERVAELTESGTRWLAGMLRLGEASWDELPQVTTLSRRLTEPWQALGMAPSSLEAFTLTSFIGRDHQHPASLQEAAVLRSVTRLRDTAEALTDRLRA